MEAALYSSSYKKALQLSGSTMRCDYCRLQSHFEERSWDENLSMRPTQFPRKFNKSKSHALITDANGHSSSSLAEETIWLLVNQWKSLSALRVKFLPCSYKWIFDAWASAHMTPVKHMFKSLEIVNPYPVQTADKPTVLVERRRTVEIFIYVNRQKKL